jgi:hypothetical protein
VKGANFYCTDGPLCVIACHNVHLQRCYDAHTQLGRLKANYQLSELVRVEGYLEWVELAASFTVKSFQQWQHCSNSVHYLLALWGRLVSAVPYVRPEVGAKNHTQRLQECVRLVSGGGMCLCVCVYVRVYV